jgi:lipopolysaccharide export system protein LptC
MINSLPKKFPIIIIIIIALFTFWIDKTVRQPTKELEKDLQNNPDYIMENFSTYQVDHIREKHEKLLAEKMLHYVANDTTYFEQPRLINSKVDKLEMRVRADKANMSGEDDIHLNGNVKVVRYDAGGGETIMTTSYLHINRDDDISKTNKPATIIQNNTIINTVGIEIDNNTHIIHLLSDVKFVHDKIR